MAGKLWVGIEALLWDVWIVSAVTLHWSGRRSHAHRDGGVCRHTAGPYERSSAHILLHTNVRRVESMGAGKRRQGGRRAPSELRLTSLPAGVDYAILDVVDLVDVPHGNDCHKNGDSNNDDLDDRRGPRHLLIC